MKQQTFNFNNNTISKINFIDGYRSSSKTESRTEGSQVKLTPTQKTALQAICKEQGVGVSTFIADALDTYIELYPYRNKIIRHRETLVSLLNSLS